MKCNFFSVCIIVILAVACGGQTNDATNNNIETARQGTFKLVVEESFKPAIEKQMEVFLSTYPKIKIEVEYQPEAVCYRMLDTDSATRMIITSRMPTPEEEEHYKNKFDRGVSYDAVALDAVAIVLNPNVSDVKLTLDDIREALLGKSKKGYKAVFDNNKETSNARFIRDSLLKTDTMPESVSAVKGNQAVIDYVARNANAMGFVGANWLSNSDAPDQFQDVKKVKIAGVQCQRGCPSFQYPKPYLYRIATKQYPLVRGVYYVVKNDYGGVATNFAKWLELERGQLIFNHANMPGTKQRVTAARDAVVENY